MTSFSRQDVQRILQISSRQLQGWEKAGLISPRESYTFQDLGQLRTLRVAARGGCFRSFDSSLDRSHAGGCWAVQSHCSRHRWCDREADWHSGSTAR